MYHRVSSAMSRARVWTNSFTVAAHVEQASRTRQFAQRLRDTADEELVRWKHSQAAVHRKPDLAAELDRADEAAEAEVDEETHLPRSNDSC